MFLTEDLTELTSIVAEAGLPEIAGEMLQYALARVTSPRCADTENEDKMEPISQITRAVDFLFFQLVLAERHVQEAEKIASDIQDQTDTSVMFIHGKSSDVDDEPIPAFAMSDRKESWSNSRRNRLITALEVALTNIGKQADGGDAT